MSDGSGFAKEWILSDNEGSKLVAQSLGAPCCYGYFFQFKILTFR